MGNDFSVKEIVIDTNNKLDKFIDKFEAEAEKTDKRLDILENGKSFAMGAVWLLTGSGILTGVYFLANFIITK